MSIFWNPENYTEIKTLSLGVLVTGTVDLGGGTYLLKAGTPISNAGAIKNDGNAKYLVAEDFVFIANNPTQAKLVKVIAKGYVDLAAAQTSFGANYAGSAKSALATAGIILVDNKLSPTNVGVTAYTLPAASASALGGVKLAANQADSTASTVADLVTDFNSLLDKLQTAGVMASAAT